MTDEDAKNLLHRLELVHGEATVAIGNGEWIVYLLTSAKAPPMAEYQGWPIRYERLGSVRAL